MAISDDKQDIKLGKTRFENIKNIDANFVALFDSADTLDFKIGGKLDKNPDGSNQLIVSNKINMKYLPDSILGQLYYKGVWAPSSGGTSSTSPDAATTSPQKGDYYIAGDSGNYNPEKKTVSGVSYSTGDWAVYNGTSWDKVDNTDAVMMVNGQIGAVKTYKGAYSADVTYYNGDIVLSDGCLYLCIATSTSKGVAPSNTSNWKIFGKIYSNATTTASGLMSFDDKKKLDGIEAGAQANKDAFSQINIGNTEIKATNKTDTFKIVAGTNVTLTADTAKKEITIKAKDTTYSVMTGATESAPGSQGLVPAPAAGKQSQYLKGDGTWATPKIGKYLTKTFESTAFDTATNSLFLYDPELNPDSYSILRVYKTDATNKYLEADVMIGIDLSGDTHKYLIYTDEKFAGMIEYIRHIVT